MDEILEQKIRFARELVVALKIAIIVLCLVTVSGAVYAVYQGRILAAVMGWLAGVAGSGFLLFHFVHIHAWLDANVPRKDREVQP